MTAGDLLDRATEAAALASRAGADAAEVYMARSEELEVKVRNGVVERTTAAGGLGCGVRVDRGSRQGFASTTDLSKEGLCSVVDAALAIAARVPEDPDGRLPEAGGGEAPPLDLFDAALGSLTWERAVEIACRVEAAALASDPRVTAGEGSTFARSDGIVAIASSKGVSAAYSGTRCALGCAPVAVQGEERQRQVWFEGRRFFRDLPEPEEVGRVAAGRALRMLGARALRGGRAPVVFDPVEGSRFWGGLVPALIGDAVRRGVSFLAGDLGRPIAARGVHLVEDPCLPRAPGSRPFDGEGCPTSRRLLIEDGVLASFLYDSRTARRAGTSTTGSALRGYSSPPSPGAHALHLAPGDRGPGEILKAAGKGLYVTHLMGFGVNLVTGDYSRGASGWWFENGEYAFPVHEVTLSGNLRDLLRGVTMIGDDLVFRSSFGSPTFLVEGFVLSGRGA